MIKSIYKPRQCVVCREYYAPKSGRVLTCGKICWREYYNEYQRQWQTKDRAEYPEYYREKARQYYQLRVLYYQNNKKRALKLKRER